MAFNISYRFQVLDGFSPNVRKFQTQLKKIGPIMAKVARNVQTGFRSMANGMDKARGRMTGMSLAMTAFGILAGKSILDFERGMNTMEAASEATAAEMVLLRKAARDMGRTTAFTAGQAGFAMAQLGQSGFSASQNIKTIPAVLNLAAAGSLELAEAAKIMSGSLKGFGLDVSQSNRVVDVLAKTASSAKTTVREMGSALAKIGSLAGEVGTDFETVNAILAIFQDRNIDSAIAGTGLKTIMLRLSKATSETKKGFEGLGFSIKRVTETMRKEGIVELFRQLREAGLDLTSAGLIFGSEAVLPAITLAKSTADVEKLVTKLRAANKVGERMAKIMLKGLPGAFLIAQSAFESFQLELGKAGLTNRLISLANLVRDLSGRLEKIDPFLLGMVIDLGFLFIAVTALLLPIAIFVKTMSILMGVFSGMAGIAALSFLFAPLSGVALSLLAVTAAVARLAFAWGDLKKAFQDRGFLAGLKTFFGLDFEAGLRGFDKTSSLTKKLEQNLRNRGIAFPRAPGFQPSAELSAQRIDMQNRLASRSVTNKVDLDGTININTDSGSSVQSAEIAVSGAGGNLGTSIAGAQ